MASAPGWFVGTGLAALTVLASPPLSAAALIETIEAAASERAFLIGSGRNRSTGIVDIRNHRTDLCSCYKRYKWSVRHLWRDTYINKLLSKIAKFETATTHNRGNAWSFPIQVLFYFRMIIIFLIQIRFEQFY